MATLVRIIIALAMVVLAFVLDWSGALSSFNRLLLDGRFALAARPASGQVVVVEIDSRSLARVGVWPWPRSIHADLLERLLTLGASDVAFDIDFSLPSNPDDDQHFADALADAGGYAYLAAFQQNEGPGGGRIVTQPLARFARNAEVVGVNVDVGRQGNVVSFASALETASGTIPALAVALAAADPEPVRSIYIDYGINLAGIDRISAADVLAGTVDPRRVAGRQVIIGASAIELRDQFAVPRFGFVSGAMVQAAALETLRQGRGLISWGSWPGFAAVLLGLGLGIWLRRGMTLERVGVLGGSVMVLGEGGAILLQRFAGIIVATGAVHLAVLLLCTLKVIDELRAEYLRRQAAQQRLAFLARHDPVTGVLSRQGLLEAFPRGAASSVLLVGILRLDLVRGSLGHDIAEATLRLLADRLRGLRLGILALVDRDTFAIAWDGPVGREELLDHCRAIAEAIEPALGIGGHIIFVDADFGSASGDDAATVLRQAELARSEGSTSPRMRLSAFTPALQARVIARRRIDSELRQALERGEIGVQFQPQVHLGDGALYGVEALVRWEHAEFGVVSPADFIPLAEETGLIIPLGAFVLAEACRLAAAWDWDGRLAVNVSAAQLQLSEIGATLDEALASSGFPARRLELELTESILVEQTGRVAALLESWKRRGIGIAIDDFGTGYSSLAYLADLAFDTLKIDRGFTARVESRTPSAEVVESIVELGHRLGKTVIAEGIETEAQRATLAQLGCDLGQGYLFGRPAPAADIARMIARTARLAG